MAGVSVGFLLPLPPFRPCFFPFVLRPTFLTLHRDVSAASNFTDFLATFAHGMHLGLLPCLRGTHNANFFLHLVHSPASLQAAQFSAQSETTPRFFSHCFVSWDSLKPRKHLIQVVFVHLRQPVGHCLCLCSILRRLFFPLSTMTNKTAAINSKNNIFPFIFFCSKLFSRLGLTKERDWSQTYNASHEPVIDMHQSLSNLH